MIKEVRWGSLTAVDEPHTLFWKGQQVPLYDSEAKVAFELVRFGQISIERVCLLAPLAEDGNDDALAHSRISRIRAKLRGVGAEVKIINRRGYGWELNRSGSIVDSCD